MVVGPEFLITLVIHTLLIVIVFLANEWFFHAAIVEDNQRLAESVDQQGACLHTPLDTRRFGRISTVVNLGVGAATVLGYMVCCKLTQDGLMASRSASRGIMFAASYWVWVFPSLCVALWTLNPISAYLLRLKYGNQQLGLLSDVQLMRSPGWDRKSLRKAAITLHWFGRLFLPVALAFPFFAMNWYVIVGPDRIIHNGLWSVQERVIEPSNIETIWELAYATRRVKQGGPEPLIAVELKSGEIFEYETFSFMYGDVFLAVFEDFAEQHGIGYDKVQFLPDRLQGNP